MKFYARNQVMMRLVACRDAIAIARMIRSLQFSEPCRVDEPRGLSDTGLNDWVLQGALDVMRAHIIKYKDAEVSRTADDVIEYLLRDGSFSEVQHG